MVTLQLLEEQLCAIEAELDARDRKRERPGEELTEKVAPGRVSGVG